MGVVYTQNQALEHAYPAVDQGPLEDILIDPSQQSPTYTMASLTKDEVTTILKKLDSLAFGNSPQVALMLAEGAYAVIKAVQLVKAQSKQQFRGEFAQGAALDLRLMRPKDVGGIILSPASTPGAGATGLYGGVAPLPGTSGVYTWLHTHVVVSNVTTTPHLVPSQTMELYAALVYLGFINRIEVPKVDAFQSTLYGVAVPAQSADFQASDKTFGGFGEVPAVKLEKPVIVPPLGIQALDVCAYASGDDRIQPIAILVARAQELTLAT